MNTRPFAVASSILLSLGLTAQTWTYPMHPRAGFHRANNDSQQPPLVLDLVSMGIVPGQWLRVGTTGGFSWVSGGADTQQSLVGVFSGSATLLSATVPNRVVDAIGAGPSFPSPGTWYGSLPMDIDEDFFCSRQGWDSSVVVPVPPGATHLFLGVHDSLYGDNSDPNGDYRAVVSVVPTPTLPGTGEHLTLASAVDGTPAAMPDGHVSPPGATMVTTMRHPVGFLDGEPYALFADVIPTGGQVPNPLPGLWSVNLLVLKVGTLSNAPGWSDTWTLQAVAGFPGTTVIVQAGALSSRARNGWFETTAAHTFDWL